MKLLALFILFLFDQQTDFIGKYAGNDSEETVLELKNDNTAEYSFNSTVISFTSYSVTTTATPDRYHIQLNSGSFTIFGVLKDFGNDQIGFMGFTDESLRNSYDVNGELVTLTRE